MAKKIPLTARLREPQLAIMGVVCLRANMYMHARPCMPFKITRKHEPLLWYPWICRVSFMDLRFPAGSVVSTMAIIAQEDPQMNYVGRI
jgi:hypothetical protein